MFNKGHSEERAGSQRRFVAVAGFSRSEGIGQALQVAFRDGLELPHDMRACLEKLDRMTF